jgi:hypothetical protein
MANYPQELAQDAAYQSRTGRPTGLWFLLKLALGLNTNYYYYYYYTKVFKEGRFDLPYFFVYFTAGPKAALREVGENYFAL